jgi:predicted O-methyltransferase YrrM
MHVLSGLKSFKNPYNSLAIGTPEIQYVSAPELLYIITRIMKPNVVVETGVASGVSSAYILQALEDNEKGELYSIDISAYVPRGVKPTGWIVPSSFRRRWHLIIGSSSQKLPHLLENLREIDVFLHDSLHTYENMSWEYKTAWPLIRKGGILLSDDIQENDAFSEFCKYVNRKGVYFGNSFGGIRK